MNVLQNLRRLSVPIILLVLIAAVLGVKGCRKTVRINDYDCYRTAGGEALRHSPTIYTKRTREGRPFHYPPAASILLAPTAFFNDGTSAFLFNVIKMIAFGYLIGVSVLIASGGARGASWMGWLALAGVAVIFRPIDNDFGNGQINIIVNALSVVGIWIIMKGDETALRWLGYFMVSVSISLKLTPLILLAVLFLHRKWKDLGIIAVITANIMYTMPSLWYGGSETVDLFNQYQGKVQQLLNAMVDRDEHRSLTEFVFANLPYHLRPRGHVEIKRLWWLLAVSTGIVVLLVRFGRSRFYECNWGWDLAVFAVMLTFLSPLVRKAHLVNLVFPIIFLIGQRCMGAQSAKDILNSIKTHLIFWSSILAVATLAWIGDGLAIRSPFSGLELKPLYLFVQIILLLMLALQAGQKRTRPAAQQIGDVALETGGTS